MYRILPKKLIFIAFGWLVLGLLAITHAVGDISGLALRSTGVPAMAWLVLSAILWNPVWRRVWRRFPALNKWIFPDLNGEWDVELCSNWARQIQLLEAAASENSIFDIRRCSESDLAALEPIKLRAEIMQSWWSLEMHLSNPQGTTPIDRSDTINIDPIRREGLRPAGICYFFKQVNRTANLADDAEFMGAARLDYDLKSDRLSGLFWTARMWPRAMNTAGSITFTRLKA